MELNRQTCQTCGRRHLANVLRRGEGHPLTVYVICPDCRTLVARYKVGGYYHHGKGFASWLRRHEGLHREGAKNLQAEFEEVRDGALDELEDVLEQLQAEDKEL